MSFNQPIGVNKVGVIVKEACETLGLRGLLNFAEMSFNQPIGVNKVGVMVKEACETLGLRGLLKLFWNTPSEIGTTRLAG